MPRLKDSWDRIKNHMNHQFNESPEEIPSFIRRISHIDMETEVVDGQERFRVTVYGDWPYKDVRKNFWELVTDLYERNRDEFFIEEQVFRLFLEASFNGNLLPVARLVNKTYGETNGVSAFRYLGETTKKK